MQVTIKALMGAGLDPQAVARLAQLEGTAAEEAVNAVVGAAVEYVRRQNEDAVCLDVSRPDRHVLTLTGQIVGLRGVPQWIKESGLMLREMQRQEGMPT
jgi:hypothetical protein